MANKTLKKALEALNQKTNQKLQKSYKHRQFCDSYNTFVAEIKEEKTRSTHIFLEFATSYKGAGNTILPHSLLEIFML